MRRLIRRPRPPRKEVSTDYSGGEDAVETATSVSITRRRLSTGDSVPWMRALSPAACCCCCTDPKALPKNIEMRSMALEKQVRT